MSVRSNSRTVAVTSAQSALGTRLTQALTKSGRVHRSVVVHGTSGPKVGAGEFVADLSSTGGAEALAAAIDAHDVDTVIYLGYLGHPGEARDTAAEVRALGKAVAARPVRRIVFASTTAIYGALPSDPTYSDEDTLFADTAHSEWVRDKIAGERAMRDLTLEVDAGVTILRFGLVLGSSVPSFITDYLQRKAAPVIEGEDPPLQFVHEDDVIAALVHAALDGVDGPFNVVGEGALPLSLALRMGRRRIAPVSALGAYPLHHVLYDADVANVAPEIHDLFRYVWVADASRCHEELRFIPRYSSKEAAEDFYRKKT
jgi:UDP-glucose 4-epimerase